MENKEDYWVHEVTGIRIGDTDEYEYSFGNLDAIIDTSNVCSYAPSYYADWIQEQIMKWSITNEIEEHPYYGKTVNCNELKYFPNIYLLFGGYWF